MKNCFDENSNLAILAGKYDIPSPEEHGYSPTLIELVQRILTVRSKDRPDIEDVIDCLHALQLDMELPPSRSRDATLSCEMDKDNKAGSTSQPPQSGPLEAPYEQARKSTSFTAQVQKNVTAKPVR